MKFKKLVDGSWVCKIGTTPPLRVEDDDEIQSIRGGGNKQVIRVLALSLKASLQTKHPLHRPLKLRQISLLRGYLLSRYVLSLSTLRHCTLHLPILSMLILKSDILRPLLLLMLLGWTCQLRLIHWACVQRNLLLVIVDST